MVGAGAGLVGSGCFCSQPPATIAVATAAAKTTFATFLLNFIEILLLRHLERKNGSTLDTPMVAPLGVNCQVAHGTGRTIHKPVVYSSS